MKNYPGKGYNHPHPRITPSLDFSSSDAHIAPTRQKHLKQDSCDDFNNKNHFFFYVFISFLCVCVSLIMKFSSESLFHVRKVGVNKKGGLN